LAAAARRIPVVVDGFIAGAAALAAARMSPLAREYLLASHRSAEPGHGRILCELGLVPYLDLSLRLGEGTRAALLIAPPRPAVALLAEMAAFESAGVSTALPGGERACPQRRASPCCWCSPCSGPSPRRPSPSPTRPGAPSRSPPRRDASSRSSPASP